MNRYALTLLLTLCTTAVVSAQEQPPAESPAQPPAAAGQRPGPNSQEPQLYEKVITKDATSKSGIFTVHQVKDRYYYEIPKSEFGREFLWNTQIARTTLGVGYGGQQLTDRVVRWELDHFLSIHRP